MAEEKHFTEGDKLFVLNWMQEHCCGRENARFRTNEDYPEKAILIHMPRGIDDRKWRWIISALIQEGHVYSSASFGYFFMPPVHPSALDIQAARESLEERKSKALSMLEKIEQNLRNLIVLEQGVKDFFFS